MISINLLERQKVELVTTIEDLLLFSREADLRSLAFVMQIGPREHRLGLAGGYLRRPTDAYMALLLLEQKLRWGMPMVGTR